MPGREEPLAVFRPPKPAVGRIITKYIAAIVGVLILGYIPLKLLALSQAAKTIALAITLGVAGLLLVLMVALVSCATSMRYAVFHDRVSVVAPPLSYAIRLEDIEKVEEWHGLEAAWTPKRAFHVPGAIAVGTYEGGAGEVKVYATSLSYNGVLIKHKDGKKTFLGTEDPKGLIKAIEEAMGKAKQV